MSTHGHREWNKRNKRYHTGLKGRRRVRDEKLCHGYNVHYLGDDDTKNPDFTTTQYIPGSKLHSHSLSLYKYK